MRFSILFLITLCVAGCSEDVIHDLTELQANKVVLELNAQGVEAAKKKRGSKWDISVDSDDAKRAISILEHSPELRRTLKPSSDKNFGPIPGKAERQLLREEQISSELAHSIEKLDGVREARVHLHLPEESDTTASKTGSALVVLSEGATVRTEEVQAILSGGSGIKSHDIAVIFVNQKEATSTNELQEPNLTTSSPQLVKTEPTKFNTLALIFGGAFVVSVILLIVVTRVVRRRR